MAFDARAKKEAEAAPRDSTATQDRGEKASSWNPVVDGHSLHPTGESHGEDVKPPQYSPREPEEKSSDKFDDGALLFSTEADEQKSWGPGQEPLPAYHLSVEEYERRSSNFLDEKN